VTPKSIDEAVIDFSGTVHLEHDLLRVGREIKRRVRAEIGEWISCNIGIATNRFLAKLAASLHKPDGLDQITHDNLEAVFAETELLDLCGINTRFQARLNVHGIYTPLQLLSSPLHVLKGQVFRSICGYYWFLRVRGRRDQRPLRGIHHHTGDHARDGADGARPGLLRKHPRPGRSVRHNAFTHPLIHRLCADAM
jgi:DNA polymerase-4